MASKVFNDPVHKHIEIPSICVKIVNTPQFQRLRRIKQLGLTSYVYPGANHTRFEHSIGVCYLARKVVRRLQEIHGRKMISDQEAARVEIAGLCHDLGHGPMSHAFEKVTRVKHEKKSWEMFQHLIHANRLETDLKEAAGDGALVCIKDLIYQLPDEDFRELETSERDFLKKQREPEKRYLYQIVANEDTGVDVDRWDYFARDALYLGANLHFQYDRILPYMRICDCTTNGQTFKGIAYRDKVKEELLILFRTRFNLYRKAYLHRVVKAVEIMTLDAFQKIKDVAFLHVPGESEPLSLKKASEDIKTYQYLDDCIVKVIRNSTDGNLNSAKEIFDRIDRRDLYTFVGQMEAKDDKEEDIKAIDEAINALKKRIKKDEDSGVPEEVSDDLEGPGVVHFGTDDKEEDIKAPDEAINALKKIRIIIKKDDKEEDIKALDEAINALKKIRIIIKKDEDSGVPEEVPDDLEGHVNHIGTTQMCDLHYGQKDQNPFDAMFFYSKDDDQTARHVTDDELPLDLPKKWRYRFHRFYVKTSNMTDGKKKNVIKLVKETLRSISPISQIPQTPPGQGSTLSAPPKPDSKRPHSSDEDDGGANKSKRTLDFSGDNNKKPHLIIKFLLNELRL